MDEDAKVFSSNITRGQEPSRNNLHELIHVQPAKQMTVHGYHGNEYQCEFQPKTGKVYVPKRRTKPIIKVCTVRDIRKLYETDVFPDLTKDLERQQNYLLKKITCGSFREEKTKSLAKTMLKCDKPISRSCWQMLVNLNPHGHAHAIQYVLWNGRCIRVNGSKGGKNKFICNYDLEKKRKIPKTEDRKRATKKSVLLRNSLNIRFKPGPLIKKRSLDDSYQKHNVGNIDLVNIPKPGLDIYPKFGIPLEPFTTKFVHSLRDLNGAISDKWAEFSVSALGSIKNKEVVQNYDSAVTFELSYKYDQQRMLMRRDFDTYGVEDKCESSISLLQKSSDFDVNSEVETVLNKIIDAVEISLQQDDMYTGEDEPREQHLTASTSEAHTAPKEKSKKRFSELERLDVTVIRLPETPKDDVAVCANAHCSLGCICSSLQQSYNLKQHCGRLDCMFQCKCDFSKYKAIDAIQNDYPGFIPGLINLDNELNIHLAKEEQKFHQTVVMTGEKSIVLKSEKRNWKATKRYRHFLNTISSKSDVKRRDLVAVTAIKLNLENVEPWCMVHNLYKCFCKGKFTHANDELVGTKEEVNETFAHEEKSDSIKDYPDLNDKIRPRTERISDEGTSKPSSDIINFIKGTADLGLLVERDTYSICARTRPYAGRKYYISYYQNTNNRIQQLEANDKKLRERLMAILKRIDSCEGQPNPDCHNLENSGSNESNLESNDESSRSSAISVHKDSKLGNIDGNNPSESLSYSMMDSSSSDSPSLSTASTFSEVDKFTPDRSILNKFSTNSKSRFSVWLETSYKQYKNRLDQGIPIKCLESPKHGSYALHSWEFILSRYRERKNIFLITKEMPYRTFMARDVSDSFFRNCINIDEIRFAELHKYPPLVRNLLTNATDLKDNFCILRGLPFCWEMVGIVTKTDKSTATQNPNNDLRLSMNQSPNKSEITESTKATDKQILAGPNKIEGSATGISDTQRPRRSQRKIIRKRKYGSEDETENESNLDTPKYVQDKVYPDSQPHTVTSDGEQSHEKVLRIQEIAELSIKEREDLTDTSKWFVMTVENDFNEIQFYKRGFFVKYDIIIKAINVARMSGKTVRLSSQKCSDANGEPQFGIYAIPDADEYYIFVGPYEKDEPLGIETVKSFSGIMKQKRTRGVWITTKKTDNIKVIDNPLAFMPPEHAQPINVVADEIGDKLCETTHKNPPAPQEQPQTNEPAGPAPKDQVKVVKPIKIRKTNGFYQLASHGLLKPIAPKTYRPAKPVFTKSILQPILLKTVESDQQVKKIPTIPGSVPGLLALNTSISTSLTNKTNNFTVTSIANCKPVAEIAPQIKIVDVYSESEAATKPRSFASIKPDRGMLILKPEEINKRMMENTINVEVPSKSDDGPSAGSAGSAAEQGDDLDLDIESFLATSSVFVPPNADIFEISDDEDSEGTQSDWKPIFIESTNIKHLGYLRGRRRVDGCISFEFPGFKYTDFYEEQEAYFKINQVLSRKVYVPTKVVLHWRAVDSLTQLHNRRRLTADQLGADFVVTKQGLRHKRLVVASARRPPPLAPISATSTPTTPAPAPKKLLIARDLDDAIDILSDMDEQSRSLEEQGDALLTEMVSARRALAAGPRAAQEPPTPTLALQEEQATLRLLTDPIDIDESSASNT